METGRETGLYKEIPLFSLLTMSGSKKREKFHFPLNFKICIKKNICPSAVILSS